MEQVVTASNVTAFSAAPFLNMHGATILINGQTVRSNPTRTHLHWFLTVGGGYAWIATNLSRTR